MGSTCGSYGPQRFELKWRQVDVKTPWALKGNESVNRWVRGEKSN